MLTEEMREMTIEDLKVIALALFRNKLLIFLFTVAGLCVGFLYHARQPIVYTYGATATVSVVYDTISNQGQISGTTVLSNYAEIITSDRVCEYAAGLLSDKDITADQIRNMISTASKTNSYILKITARNQTPSLAILVANAVSESFATQVSVITGNDSIQVLDIATTAAMSSSGRNNQIRIIVPAIAFIVACVFVVITEIVSGKLRSVKQCVPDIGELLAVIPKVNRKNR